MKDPIAERNVIFFMLLRASISGALPGFFVLVSLALRNHPLPWPFLLPLSLAIVLHLPIVSIVTSIRDPIERLVAHAVGTEGGNARLVRLNLTGISLGILCYIWNRTVFPEFFSEPRLAEFLSDPNSGGSLFKDLVVLASSALLAITHLDSTILSIRWASTLDTFRPRLDEPTDVFAPFLVVLPCTLLHQNLYLVQFLSWAPAVVAGTGIFSYNLWRSWGYRPGRDLPLPSHWCTLIIFIFCVISHVVGIFDSRVPRLGLCQMFFMSSLGGAVVDILVNLGGMVEYVDNYCALMGRGQWRQGRAQGRAQGSQPRNSKGEMERKYLGFMTKFLARVGGGLAAWGAAVAYLGTTWFRGGL
jgi:hypothetical protein